MTVERTKQRLVKAGRDHVAKHVQEEMEADRFKDPTRQLGGAAAVLLFAGWYLYLFWNPWWWVLMVVGLVLLVPALALYYL